MALLEVDLRRRRVDRVARLVEARRAHASALSISSQDPAATLPVGADGLPPISILGDRGAGKTTLLLQSIADLKRNPHNVVLPVIKPEMFSSEDSLFVHVLTALEVVLIERQDIVDCHVEIHGESMTIAQWVEVATRQAALARTSYEGRLSSQNVTPEQFAAEFARVSRSERDFQSLWVRLMGEIASRSDDVKGGSGLIVVPIDDADLVPEFLPDLFVELRLLTSSPAVLPIVCLNLSETRTALMAGLLTSSRRRLNFEPLLLHNLAAPADFKVAIEKQLTKALPADHRVTVAPILLSDRLNFTTLSGADNSLLDLMRSKAVQRVAGPLDEYFIRHDLSGDEYDAIASTALPGVPRELGILHAALLEATHQESDAAATYVAAFVEELVSFAIFSGQTPPDREIIQINMHGDVIEVHQSTGQFELRFRPSPTINTWSVEQPYGFRVVNLSLARLGGLKSFAISRPAPANQPPAPRQVGEDMTGPLLAAVLLAQELSLEAPRFVRSSASSNFLGLNPGSLFEVVSVAIDDEPTDDRFFELPNWYYLSDLSDFLVGWNRLLQPENADSQLNPVSAVAVEGIILAFIALVTDIASHNAFSLSAKLIKLEGRFLGDDSRANSLRKRLWAEVMVTAAAEYRRGSSRRRAPFVRWFERDLVALLHPALLPWIRIEQVLEARAEALKAARRWQRGNDHALLRFTQRTKARSPGRWIDGLIDVAARLDERKAAEVRYEVEERRRSQAAPALGRVAIPPDVRSSLPPHAPNRTANLADTAVATLDALTAPPSVELGRPSTTVQR